MGNHLPATDNSNYKLITFWSAPGSPGRTTLACAVATELVESGKRVLLIDADTYAPSIDVLLGLNDHPAGLAAACRLVGQQRFDLEQLQRLSVELDLGSKKVTVMTGLSSATRWPEIAPEKLEQIIRTAGAEFDYILLDVAAATEGQILCPQSSVERNSISRWALANSDQVIAISGSEPVAIARHLEAMSALTELRPIGEVLTVVNRLRNSVLGFSAKQQIIQTLSSLGQLQVSGFVPDDPAAADAALKTSTPLAMGKRTSQARMAVSLLTKTKVLGERTPLDRRLFRSAEWAVAKLG